MRARASQPQSGRVVVIAEIREEKNGGVVRVPDHLGQINYAEICIFVTKYISKLNKIQITSHLKYLYFNYLTNLHTNTKNDLGFSHALPAAHAL